MCRKNKVIRLERRWDGLSTKGIRLMCAGILCVFVSSWQQKKHVQFM